MIETWVNTYLDDTIIEASYNEYQVVELDIQFLENDNTLYNCFEENPENFLTGLEKWINNSEHNSKASDWQELDVKVRICNNTMKRTPIRKIKKDKINKFIKLEGIVKSQTNETEQILTNGAFECQYCGHITMVPQDTLTENKPFMCENETCEKKGHFKLNIDLSTFSDHQVIKIQETPDSSDKNQPEEMTVHLYDDLTGTVDNGEKIIVNGIVKNQEKRKSDSQYKKFFNYVDANNIEKTNHEFDETDITDEELEQFMKIAERPDVVDFFADNIAPSIHKNETVKKALAAQLFSGVTSYPDELTRVRGDIHILLVGDPGVAKSQMLRYMSKLSPKGVYTSNSSTGVGLTAAVVQDENNEWTLQAGSLVMADMGLAAIDELDKFGVNERQALHESFAQQTVSINKSNIHATLNSRCSILAAANPKYGRFDRYESIAGQINISPTLLSRFDLIFVLQDHPNDVIDTEVATKILNNHHESSSKKQAELKNENPISNQNMQKNPNEVSIAFLKKYISYARNNIIPVLTNESKESIINFFLRIRNMREDNDHAIPITHRGVESLKRIAEAFARMRLSNTVTKEDAELAIDITYHYLKKVGVDPETGSFDLDVIEVGMSNSQREKIRLLKDCILELSDTCENKKGVPLEYVYNRENDLGMNKKHINNLISKMKEKGELYSLDEDHVSISQ